MSAKTKFASDFSFVFASLISSLFTGAILKMVRERKYHETYKKPILATWIGGREYQDLVLDLKSAGVPIYPSSWRTARSMLGLYLEGKRIKKDKKRKL